MHSRARSVHSQRFHRLARQVLAAPALIPLLLHAPASSAVQPEPTSSSRAAPEPSTPELLKTIEDRTAPRADRLSAASRLLDRPDSDPAVQQDILRLLRTVTSTPGPTADPVSDPSAIIFEAIARLSSAPEWLFHDLAVAARSDHPHRLTAIRALGGIRTRASLAELVALTREQPSSPAVAAAFTALERLTARSDLPRDAAAWDQYLATATSLPDDQWQRQVVQSLAAQLDEARASERLVVDRLTDIARQQLAAAAPGAQSDLLAALVTDTSPAVRRAGLSLALQELANARPVSPALASAAEPALTDADPSLRRLAAELIFLLAPPEAATAIHRALVRERDPQVAAALLQGPIRWPSAATLPAILRWLDEASTLDRALEALAAADAAGITLDDADRRRVLAILRSSPAPANSTSRTRLLLSWGDEQDLKALAERLASDDLAIRRRTAEAIAASPRALPMLLDHAAAPDVFPSAARAVAEHAPTLENYRRLATVAPTIESAREALLSVANRLAPTDLLAVAQQQNDPTLREAMLQPLIAQPLRYSTSPFSGRPVFSQSPGVAEGLVLLARTRLSLRQPAAALQALDAIAVQPSALTAECADLRTLALVQLARHDEAAALASGPAVWVEALENVAAQPQAVATLNILESRFGSQLDNELAARVLAVRERLGLTFGPSPAAPR